MPVTQQSVRLILLQPGTQRTPKDHNATQPKRGGDLLQNHVGRHLKQDVLSPTSQHAARTQSLEIRE